MADYPNLVLADIAGASGNAVGDYDRPDFIPEAIKQATLLFKIGTCLAALSEDPTDYDLSRYGIISMADAIYWAQPFQKVLRSPFSSETIGSYSYSKLTAAVSAGLPTGVSWFDIAVGKLSVCDQMQGLPMSGGWNVFEEHKEAHDGYGVFLGPADKNLWQPPFGEEL